MGMAKRKFPKNIGTTPKQIIEVEMISKETGLKTRTKGSTLNDVIDANKTRFKNFKVVDVLIKSSKKTKQITKQIPKSDFQKYKQELINKEQRDKRLELMAKMGMVVEIPHQ